MCGWHVRRCCGDGHLGGERLVCGFPDVIDVPSVFLACFVVEDLVVYDVTAILEVVHDSDAGWDVVAVFACLEGLDYDGIGFAVIGNHEVLFAAARAEREAYRVVCVERADGFHPDVELSGQGGGSRRGGEVGLPSQ